MGGRRIKDIENLVRLREVARAVTFESADNYATSLYREELVGDDVLLAYTLDYDLLDDGLGAPVCLVVPNKYAYKVRFG